MEMLPRGACQGALGLCLLMASALGAVTSGDPDVIFGDGFESAECSLWSRSSEPFAAPDADADTFGDENQPTTICALPAGLILDTQDCDDSQSSIHPGAMELCDGIDQDCDGVPDNDVDGNTNPACSSHIFLGTIAGDVGSPEVTAMGWTEAWYRVHFAEGSSSNLPVRGQATLIVPVGADFDLYVYCLSCGGSLVGQSNNSGDVDEVVEFRAVDRTVPPMDDSFDALIEIRYFSSTVCAPWVLEVRGNIGTSTAACSPP